MTNSKVASNGVVCKKVSAAQLFVDSDYQRHTSRSRVRRIAKDFDWAFFGILKVKPHGKKYAVVDGQHRFEAVKMVHDGLKFSNGRDVMLLCEIVPKDVNEAIAFVGTNSNCLSVSPSERFKANLYAGEKPECDIAAWLEDAGIGIQCGGRGRPPKNSTKAVGAFRKMYEKIGADRCKFVIQNILPIYCSDGSGYESAALSANFIHSLGVFLAGTNLSDCDVSDYLDEAREHGQSAASINDMGQQDSGGSGYKRWSSTAAQFGEIIHWADRGFES